MPKGMNEIAIFGLGKMGSAIAEAALRKKMTVFAYDPYVEKKNVPQGVVYVTDLKVIWEEQTTVLMAVKPDKIAEVTRLIPDDRFIISVAAGISIQQIDKARQRSGPTVRVMPNTPLLIGEGMSAYLGNGHCKSSHFKFIEKLFASCGKLIQVDNEEKMHIVTALSGSGPAFVYLFLQALEDAGVLLGMPRKEARILALQTTIGSAKLVMAKESAPQTRIHDVTSPGGTTITGLKALKELGFESAIIAAVENACKKSKELAQKAEETSTTSELGFQQE